jgi:epoxyqueuosine reductase
LASAQYFLRVLGMRGGSAVTETNSMVKASSTTWISERATQLGFAMAGVARAEKFPELLRQPEWLARGYAGEMKYLSDARRSDPQAALPDVQSVIVCALTYNTAQARTEQAFADLNDASGPHGWISRYAWGDDYHDVLREKLQMLLNGLRKQHPQPFEARIYTDTGPINERVLAKHAGLGWLGKNTLLLNERIGSFFFLGIILTTLDLPPTLRSSELPPADRCGTCRKCIDACPTEALVEPYVLDARKCISYLTIELRGAIPEQLRKPMGQHLFGCDICQDVCPWNRHAPITRAKEFQPRPFDRQSATAAAEKEFSLGEKNDASPETLFLPRLDWLASLSQSDFSAMFRGSPIKRTKWQGLIRNVCVALGNSKSLRGSAAFERIASVLRPLAASPDPVISESAQWAVSRIQANEASPVVTRS